MLPTFTFLKDDGFKPFFPKKFLLDVPKLEAGAFCGSYSAQNLQNQLDA